MVCDRCIAAVRRALFNTGFEPLQVELGRASYKAYAEDASFDNLRAALDQLGFEILIDPAQQLVQNIKNEILNLIRTGEIEYLHVNMSAHLEKKLGRDYSTLTHTFGAYEPVSIERYTILQKLEHAKDWLQTTKLSVVEISARLGYNSAAYFSNQFRQFTGYTPTQYRVVRPSDRIALDSIGRAPVAQVA